MREDVYIPQERFLEFWVEMAEDINGLGPEAAEECALRLRPYIQSTLDIARLYKYDEAADACQSRLEQLLPTLWN